MMRLLYTILFCLLSNALLAQEISFENGVPLSWQSTSANSLDIDTNYFRNGKQSLSWSFIGGIADTLFVDIDPIVGFNNGTSLQMSLFSESKKPNNLFFVQFLLGDGTVNFSYEFYQNFKGWLPIEIGYILHMRLNPPNYSGAIVKMRIISATTNVSSKLLFDKVDFDVNPSIPSISGAIRSSILPGIPYRGMTGGSIIYFTDTIYHYFSEQPVNIFAIANLQDSIEIDTIRNRIYEDLKTTVVNPTGLSLLKADSLYNWYHFSLLPNGDVKAKPIEYLDSLYCLIVIYGNYSTSYETALAAYVGDFVHNNNLASRDKATMMIKHFIRNGFGDASRYRIGATLQSYTADNLRASLCLMYSQLDSSFKADMYDLFKYQFTLGKIWDTNMIPITNSDEIMLSHWMRMATCVFFKTDYNEIKAHLLGNKKYLNNYLQPMYGKDGISADGLGFHHDFHHNAYMYSFNKTNKSYLYPLRGTQFTVDTANFTFYRNTMLTYLYLCNNYKYNPGMIGRHPHLNYPTYSRADMFYIADMEQYYYQVADRLLTKEYNRQWSTQDNSLLSTGIANYKTGFIALNYSPAAVYRFTKNGMNVNASVKGINNEFAGTEIFGNYNLFGRYQSYGNLFINYAGDKNGYINLDYPTNNTAGWDWNKWPGTTSIHLPWSELGLSSTTNIGYPFEFSNGKLAASLPHPIYTDTLFKNTGSVGVFGMELMQKQITAQHDTSFSFRKSYFFFDNKILCLGSDIKNTNITSNTCTNILQQTLEQDTISNLSLNINGIAKPVFPMKECFAQSQNNWLIDRFNSGYLFLNNTDSLIIEKKSQSTPNQNNNGIFNEANMASAFINHGKAPSSASYQYLVVPQTTVAEMQTIHSSIINNTIPDYTIIKQDSIAHAVHLTNYNAIASVIFKENEMIGLMDSTYPNYIKSNLPSISIIKKTTATELDITLVNPDLNFTTNEPIARPNPSVIRYYVAGNWLLTSQKGTGYVSASFHTISNETEIIFINEKALPIEFTLLKNFASLGLESTAFQYFVNKDCSLQCNISMATNETLENVKIEESIDAFHWNELNFIGKQKNNVYQIEFIPNKGNHFLKVQFQESNSKRIFNKIIAISNCEKNSNEWYLEENPIQKNSIKLKLYSTKNGMLQYQIFSLDGKQIMNHSLKVNIGENRIAIPFHIHKHQIYLLKGEIEGELLWNIKLQ